MFSIYKPFKSPRIHDISTDTDNPPAFTVAARLRSAWHHPVTYAGSRTAKLQRQAYPDIQPIITGLPLKQAWLKAAHIVRLFHWQILEENPGAGTIEAVAVTRIFRFRDDIAIRVSDHSSGSRVDIRSASRIGIGDLGANARRIRRFINAFNREL